MGLYYLFTFPGKTCTYAPQLAKIDQRAKIELGYWDPGEWIWGRIGQSGENSIFHLLNLLHFSNAFPIIYITPWIRGIREEIICPYYDWGGNWSQRGKCIARQQTRTWAKNPTVGGMKEEEKMAQRSSMTSFHFWTGCYKGASEQDFTVYFPVSACGSRIDSLPDPKMVLEIEGQGRCYGCPFLMPRGSFRLSYSLLEMPTLCQMI